MNCTNLKNYNNSPSFKANGTIVRKEYFKITDNLLQHIANKASQTSKPIKNIIEGKFGAIKDVKNILGDNYDKFCELADLSRQMLKQNELFPAFKKLISDLRITDENGEIKKLGLKKIIISAGEDTIDDIVEANTIVDKGSCGVKKFRGNNVLLNNVKSTEGDVLAYKKAIIRNSDLKKVEGLDSVGISDSTVTEEITSFGKIDATNVNTANIKSEFDSIWIWGEENNIKKVKAYDYISIDGTLTADHIETTIKGTNAGRMFLLLGAKSKINTLKTNGHVNMRGYGDKNAAHSTVNIDNVECNSLEAVKVKGKKYHITGENTDIETIIVGEKNEIDEIISNGKTYIENITAKKLTSDSEKDLHITGKQNNIDEIYTPKKTVYAENLTYNKINYKKFIDKIPCDSSATN